MSLELEKVKKGYLELGALDRLAVRNFIEEVEKKTINERDEIKKGLFTDIRNKSLGPMSSSACPCCGK